MTSFIDLEKEIHKNKNRGGFDCSVGNEGEKGYVIHLGVLKQSLRRLLSQ